MILFKSKDHPCRTLADVYKTAKIELWNHNATEKVIVVITDVRPLQEGDYYISSRGVVSRAFKSTKNKAMTRVIVEKVP
jgi:hypothetical protein